MTTFVWQDFLVVAKSIPQTSEAYVRTIIARAYWAAYLCAREHFYSKGTRLVPVLIKDPSQQKPRLQSHHEVVIAALALIDTNLGSKLNNLRLKRNLCDYDETLNFQWANTREVSGILTRATDVISGINALPP